MVSYTPAVLLGGDALTIDTVSRLSKCIPFLGYLFMYADAGHRVVVFEGHPTAFEAGVRSVHVLLVDSGMMPFLQDDWFAVAFRAMRPDRRIFVHERETYWLRPVSSSRFPPGWQYSEPDGEASYVKLRWFRRFWRWWRELRRTTVFRAVLMEGGQPKPVSFLLTVGRDEAGHRTLAITSTVESV